jgi:hypothetical protein
MPTLGERELARKQPLARHDRCVIVGDIGVDARVDESQRQRMVRIEQPLLESCRV